ncbi:HNH endonuclease signature motif containing protein [Ligilactobacillus salivarius]|uniref:HNH endonuclease signature motif containing protein n=1 Tax=Ligilactobacillus salivarius TaxID=1624 RepID=UPI00237E4BF0|nr:HNH endonuclease signature motif containing protein [Ligilactobacillus salivarius]MDE1526270.1 HNH endonuclease signature motif containing protein [Ligilactobacillus salivarius]
MKNKRYLNKILLTAILVLFGSCISVKADINSNELNAKLNSEITTQKAQLANGQLPKANTPETVTTLKYHIGEDYYDGNFRFTFYLDSIEGLAPYAVDAAIVLYTEPSLQGPVSINKTNLISKVGNITTGAIGSVEVPAKTTFWAAGGEYGAESTSGNVAFYPITQGPIELQNKLAQNFPEYVDPVSHKDAESPLRTDWTRLGQSPSWNGRQAFINRFNATYGTQSADWWSARQIHHIRPRIYGGTDDFNNLLPVPNANHYLITSWFRNY